MVIALAALALSGCHRAPRGPWLLLRQQVGRQHRLFMVPAGGAARDVVSVLDDVPGDVGDVLVTHGGTILMNVRDETGKKSLWRVRTSPRVERPERVDVRPVDGIEAASDDGGVILMHDGVVLFVEQNLPVSLLGAHGRVFSGDISEDGTRAVLSFVPASCTGWIGSCPIEVWGFSLPGSMEAHQIAVSARGRANYQPRFVPGTHGGEVVYQTTEHDDAPRCAKGINDCRHDVMRRDFAAKDEPTLVVQGAVGARYAVGKGGARLAVMSGWDPTHDSQGVSTALESLVVDGHAIAEQVANRAAYWSPDATWLAYVRDPHEAHAVSADGTRDVAYDDAAIVGWIAHPLPRGTGHLPAPPDAALPGDELAPAFAAYTKHAAGMTAAPLGVLAPAPPSGRFAKFETLGNDADLAAWLRRTQRVFAIAPASHACPILSNLGGPVYVLGDATPRGLLLTNQLAPGDADASPIRHDEAVAGIVKQDATLTGGGTLKLIGVDVPAQPAGASFVMTVVWRVLEAPTQPWRALVQFDGGTRVSADHDFVCRPMHWRAGDVIVDRVTVPTDGFMDDRDYTAWIGLAPESGAGARMHVASGDSDGSDRLKVGTLRLARSQ